MNGRDIMKKTPSSLDDYIAEQGRRGDSVVAHLNPREVALLKRRGGSGTINPKTGMLEFWDDGGNDPGGVGGDSGSTGFGGSDTGGDLGSLDNVSTESLGGVSGFGGYGSFDSTSGDSGSLDNVTAESLAGMNALGIDHGIDSHTKAGGFLADPMGYLAATGRIGLSNFNSDPMGTIKGMLPSAGKIGAYIGSGAGPLGMGIGYGIGSLVGSAINGDWGKMSPEERSDAIATAEAAMSNNGAGGTAPEDTSSISPAPSTAQPWISRRSILDPKYDFNKQMIGLSARNVLPTRRV